jgi:uncharacterized protein YneF (UPF0154 family)
MIDHGAVVLTLGILPFGLAILVGTLAGSFLAARIVFRKTR